VASGVATAELWGGVTPMLKLFLTRHIYSAFIVAHLGFIINSFLDTKKTKQAAKSREHTTSNSLISVDLANKVNISSPSPPSLLLLLLSFSPPSLQSGIRFITIVQSSFHVLYL